MGGWVRVRRRWVWGWRWLVPVPLMLTMPGRRIPASSVEASSAAVKGRGANVRTVLRRSQTHNGPGDVTYTALTLAELQKIGAAAVVISGGHSL